MRTKTAENKKEANIQPLDQKSLLLLFFYIYSNSPRIRTWVLRTC